MASVSQAVEAISVVTMTEEKTVNVYARALIDAGVLPKSRGRAIAHVRGEHVAKLLLAIALKPTIKEAAKVVEAYSELEAETNYGIVTAIEILSDLFGAASAGGVSSNFWHEVTFSVYENRLGIDVRLPAGRRSNRSDRELIFRLGGMGDLGPFEDVAKFFISPNRFFSRSATVSFDALLFICQLMKANAPNATAQGEEAVQRLLSTFQTKLSEDGHRNLSTFKSWQSEGGDSHD
ncbi:hypothetical protein [Aquabacter cavernae]|uniref:hypothetical protein n=1 Tax=Aquabacter cavernae TaxID=2496029 RepID=UPI000F8CF6A8|nr:hypothetical protein [Aquabacter cavernae]